MADCEQPPAKRHEGGIADEKSAELLMHAMLLTCFSDGTLQAEELAVVESYVKTLPEFRGMAWEAIFARAKATAKAAASVDEAVASLAPMADDRALANKAYVCCVELCWCAEGLSESESELLAKLRGVLRIDAEAAECIDRVFAIKYAARGLKLSAATEAVPEFDDRAIRAMLAEENPWMTIGLMNNITGGELMAAWDAVLAIQTEMFGPLELAWFRSHGFASDGATVIEVGSAAGAYGSFVARSFPKARFVGLEANQSFVDAADRSSPGWPANYSVEKCMVGVDPMPEAAKGATHCYVRYVLQHISNPIRVLSALHKQLPPGAMVFVIEEDDHLFTSSPPFPAFDAMADAWHRTCAASGTDSRIGRKLPVYLEKSGFRVDKYEIVLRTDAELGPNFFRFFALASRMFHLSNAAIVPAQVLKTIEAGFNEVIGRPHAFVATYPHVLLVATRI